MIRIAVICTFCTSVFC